MDKYSNKAVLDVMKDVEIIDPLERYILIYLVYNECGRGFHLKDIAAFTGYSLAKTRAALKRMLSRNWVSRDWEHTQGYLWNPIRHSVAPFRPYFLVYAQKEYDRIKIEYMSHVARVPQCSSRSN